MEDSVDKISLQKENIRLNEQNCGLTRENEYLRMLLERFIPIPINGQVKSLENRYSDIDKRLRKIEDMGNKAK
ncbi:MAG: hypothetical protein HFJ50_06580 [Clostridia bacterium]|jgi:hypothetical protein|nr:hypothetical protein [Clostridia bacterium]